MTLKGITMAKTKGSNPIDIHVGSRMRMRRMALGMSQEKLAKALGLTFQQVQKYEKGANRMGSSRLQHAADVLGVAAAFFFEGAGERLTNRTVVRRPQPTSTISSRARKDGGSRRRLCAYVQRSGAVSSIS
jgi:transcriptional regulator with XRE-family HTH domain